MKPVALPSDFNLSEVLPLWSLNPSGPQITREFIFKDFRQAFAFMQLCAQFAEEIDHHPDWSNSWNTVRVSLSTHSEQTLTSLDIEMAKAMDAFAINIESSR